jgi:osmotically-inducible protein OsmY
MTRTRMVLTLAMTAALGADRAGAQPYAPNAVPSTQNPPRTAASTLAEALAANPITAPYRLATADRAGRVVLAGRVGSKQVHDVAVRTAIAMNIPVSDQLVIDTSVGYAVAAAQSSGAYGGVPQGSIGTSYTYPPPLFGRFDDPFFGLEPPLSTFPPWFGAMSQSRLAQNQPMAPAQPAGTDAPPTAEAPLPSRTIEATIDPYGVATLRGVVPSDADRIEIGQRLARMPGISQVINRLTVGPVPGATAPRGQAQARKPVSDDTPPPPPTPAVVAPPPATVDEPAGRPILAGPEGAAPASASPAPAARPGPAASPAERALRDRPELADLPLKVSVRDGIASLSGAVPSVYEAMLAFRAVQQTPGVQAIIDTLRFVVPDGESPNPLLTRAKPGDAEPYLEAQIRRNVGDSAHVDRARLEGNRLVVQGTVEGPDERARVEAILRSMPVLRGFKVEPEFRALR